LALKANKWNAVEILKELAYDDRMNRMLQEGPYEVVSKTPLHRMVRQVKDMLADIKNKHGVDLKYLQHSISKTHRPGNKLHSITSNIDALTEGLWADQQLKKIVKKVKDIQLAQDEC
jgi:uncharacterized protein (DUF2461 family)